MRQGVSGRILLSVALSLIAISATGCGNGEAGADPSAVAMQSYQSTLKKEADTLLNWINRLEVAIKWKRVTHAESRYASARVAFGHLKPSVSEFPELNARLDALTGEIPGERITGFHEVEHLLWTNHSWDARRRGARQLSADLKELRRKIKSRVPSAEAIAQSLNEVMAVAVTKALSGEEEPLAHIDLVDLSADIEGVEAAIGAIEPLLLDQRAKLLKQIKANFGAVYALVQELGIAAREPHQPRPGSPGVSFVVYPEARHDQLEKLRWQIDRLDALLSKVPGVVMEAQASSP